MSFASHLVSNSYYVRGDNHASDYCEGGTDHKFFHNDDSYVYDVNDDDDDDDDDDERKLTRFRAPMMRTPVLSWQQQRNFSTVGKPILSSQSEINIKSQLKQILNTV